ncbi:MAG: type II toxin-antitoxin system VapC family toxin [Candidatus Handelsmanbacteria bacterium]|nr:type II toxin-antitoxin system VapC family toxin [Candidatus Handelsmanbacteria bacterium]
MILDTCSLLWLAQGGGSLSARARQRIDNEPLVYVSAMSGFEISIKHKKGKLALPSPPAEWVAAIVAHHDLQVLPLDMAVCIRAVELPPVHADPCDRFIIATAQCYRLPVVTADPLFAQYGIEVFF